MNAVDFLKAKEEICTSYECRQCPLGQWQNKHRKSCEELISLYPDEAVNIVEEWSKNHPDIISIHYIADGSTYTTLVTEAKNFEQRDYGEYWEVNK